MTDDAQVPVVSITSPIDGNTVSGVVVLQAAASDDVGVTNVEFYADNVLVPTSWDTTTVADGSHSLIAKAYDAAGNEGVSLSVSVTVGICGGRDV